VAAATLAGFLAVAIAQLPTLFLFPAIAGGGVVVMILGLRAIDAFPSARFAAGAFAAFALALVPFRGLGEISVGGAVLGLSDFALAIALILWIANQRRDRPGEIPRLALGIVLFAAWLGVTAIAARELTLVLKEVVKWLQVAIAIVVLADVLREDGARRAMMWAVGVAVGVEALIGIVQVLIGIGPASFNVGGVIRSFGTFEQPNPYGGYLGLHLPLILAAAIYAPKSRRPWVVALWLLVMAAIVVSRSRGAWVGMAGSTAVVLLAAMPRNRVLGAITGVVIVTVFLSFAGWQFSGGIEPLIHDPTRAAIEGRVEFRDAIRMLVDENYAVSERLAQWEIGWGMFMNDPLIGVGAGNYEVVYLKSNPDPFINSPGHAHNIYLNFAAETGLPGMLAFAALSGWALLRGLRAVQWSRGTSWEWLMVGALGGAVAFALHNLFDSLFVNGMGLVFALFIGLSYAAEWQYDRPKIRRDAPDVFRNTAGV
jgi:O-antigen ligase